MLKQWRYQPRVPEKQHNADDERNANGRPQHEANDRGMLRLCRTSCGIELRVGQER
jgi:hypothetical protein